MKKIILIILVVLCIAFPSKIMGMLGVGGAKYGISEKDPLGNTKKLHELLIGSGFTGDFGTEGTPRKLSYEFKGSGKTEGMGGGIDITVGDEEYIQKIEGGFFGSQHGPSPQKKTVTEYILEGMWQAVGGPGKPKFERKTETVMKIPWTVKFGKGFNVNETFGVSQFDTADVKGTWVYSERMPTEAIVLELK